MRVAALDWEQIRTDLDAVGCAPASPLLNPAECMALVDSFDREELFRSTIDMARHRFGQGRYRYFAHPLPDTIDRLRRAFWPHLLPIARDWAAKLGQPTPWPDDFDGWTQMCHDAGQTRPTPLLLQYEPGGWNALHRDLYGDLVFPLQVVIGLDRPGIDYTGGEFVVVEQRPRAQSKATVTVIEQGQPMVFTTRDRPIASTRGWTTAPMRHGISELRTGRRHALGLIFHDAA
ncbi:MAG: 2OG-Fe(II) oxygenase [Ilumatobacteraceae bacterium]